MGPPRAAAGLVLRTASSITHIANEPRTCVCIARQTTSLRSKSKPSPFASPSNQRSISNAAKRTSQQAVAKKEEPEEEPEQQPPPSQPQARQRDRSRIAQDFLGGPSQPPNRRPQNPLRDGNDLGLDPTSSTHTRQQPKPAFSPNEVSAEVSQRFSFLRQPHSSQPPTTTTATKSNPYGGPEEHLSSFDTLISAFSKHSTTGRKTNNRADASRMLAPRPPPGSANDPLGATLSLVHDYAEPDLSAPAFRLGPRLPRTVAVNQRRGVDLTRALTMLGSRMSANDVRGEFFRQKFHERAGLKKKRLASQRWRRRFRDNMNEIIRRVKDIRRQGW